MVAKQRVAIALSGGVDSAVAAYLLKEAGHEVIGIHMLLCDIEQEDSSGSRFDRSTEPVIEKLKRFCQRFNVPFHILDLRREFKDRVIDYFYGEYIKGRTPNPCVVCNEYIKFGLCLEKALDMYADCFATGHYVRSAVENGSYHLFKGIDSEKDQSYFLYRLDQARLARVLFPLGNCYKSDVDTIAQSNHFEVVGTRSSQDICFVGGKYVELFDDSSAIEPGDIIDKEGTKLGQHTGMAHYTVGQRHGLGISSESPLYVTRLEPDENRITVGGEQELYKSSLVARDVHWISGTFPSTPLDITIRIRYKSPEVDATIIPEHDSVTVRFKQPQRAVAPGQSIVFYQGKEVLGGGIIEG